MSSNAVRAYPTHEIAIPIILPYQCSNLMMLKAFGPIRSNINRTLISHSSALILPDILRAQNTSPRTCTILIKFTPIPWIGWNSCCPSIVLIYHRIHTCIVRQNLGISRSPLGSTFGIVIEIRWIRIQRWIIWEKRDRDYRGLIFRRTQGCLLRWFQGRRRQRHDRCRRRGTR